MIFSVVFCVKVNKKKKKKDQEYLCFASLISYWGSKGFFVLFSGLFD